MGTQRALSKKKMFLCVIRMFLRVIPRLWGPGPRCGVRIGPAHSHPNHVRTCTGYPRGPAGRLRGASEVTRSRIPGKSDKKSVVRKR